MATPKRITKEQAEANKKKQQVLRQAGYNIKVDGSWGPWQEEQYRGVLLRRPYQEEPHVRVMLRSPQQEELYRRVISKGPGQGTQQRTVTSNGEQYRKILPKEKAEKLFSKQANVGVLALPAGGAGAVQLLRGLGSVALPSLSIPAAAVGPAIILGGIAGTVYDTFTGDHSQPPLTPEQMKYGVYAPDATRVSGPIALDFPGQAKSGPIGERYVNPVLSREATRSRHLAAETANDSDAVVHVDPAGVSAPSMPPSQEPENNGQNPKKKSWRDRLFGKPKKGNNNETSSKLPSWKQIGKGYAAVVGGATASDILGNSLHSIFDPKYSEDQWNWNATNIATSIPRALGKLWYDFYAPPVDSTGRDTTQVPLKSQQAANPVSQVGDTASRRLATTLTQEQLDSVNRAFYGE